MHVQFDFSLMVWWAVCFKIQMLHFHSDHNTFIQDAYSIHSRPAIFIQDFYAFKMRSIHSRCAIFMQVFCSLIIQIQRV